MNDVNVVANALVTLFNDGRLVGSLVQASYILEKEFGFPDRMLDNAIDKLLIPQVSTVGDFRKVIYNNKVYYYDKYAVVGNFPVEFMKSQSANDLAVIIIDVKNNIVLKNRFLSLEGVFDGYFGKNE